jgi:hypothetical protein
MKPRIRHFVALIVMVLLVIPLITNAQGKGEKSKNRKNQKSENIQLFNGKDLNNWVFRLKDPSVDPSTVFTVKNGMIHITGNPFGYMRTKESYSDYRLHVEWCWPAVATNSGIFIHVQQPDSSRICGFECQLAAGNAGDLMFGYCADMNERTDKSKSTVKKRAPSSEKPTGEWNTMEVVCKSNTLEITVNGVLQNKGTNVTPSKGHICLQSEGKDIEFRNVFLTKLKK